ncbi:hypothetical protein FA15DRAFT_654874 [Coprinopsis marcescibilis]|uniref:Uncharacterized protein n=1 Tax=Coprinopsis marcescibilis TaxID=230819 RepID=A0A5C3KZG2_COPMA|nr:hypothetical protein FA15DRAFT_654874 [Coprinopsis marcescibilis]
MKTSSIVNFFFVLFLSWWLSAEVRALPVSVGNDEGPSLAVRTEKRSVDENEEEYVSQRALKLSPGVAQFIEYLVKNTAKQPVVFYSGQTNVKGQGLKKKVYALVGKDVKKDSVWLRIELPTMQKENKLVQMIEEHTLLENGQISGPRKLKG